MGQERDNQIIVQNEGSNRLRIIFPSQLNIHSVSSLWRECLDLHADHVTIDASQIRFCDGAGLALLLELKHKQSESNKTCQIEGLADQFQQLLETIDHPKKVIRPEFRRRSFAVKVGYVTVNFFRNIRENIIFIGELIYQLFWLLKHPKTLRLNDFFSFIEEVGPHALSIIALIGFLMGLIGAFQSTVSLSRFGAQIYVANLVGIGLVRELGPLMTAIILAGRTASSFAAEIGTMKINQEIDALTTMGLNPVRFLIVPRVIATLLMTPLLNMFLIFFGLVGCGMVMKELGFNLDIYLHQLHVAISLKDWIGGLVKATVFGLVIAGTGCLHGLKTTIGSKAVGYSTTQAVVNSIIMLVIVDGVFACIYYVLGI